MGVHLTPLIIKKKIKLKNLRGKALAIDGYGELYEFLSWIRHPDGAPLMDSHGNITSHLAGLMYHSTRLITDFGIHLVYVFDGDPPSLKSEELERRRVLKERLTSEYEEARAAGLMGIAFAKAAKTSRLTASMLDDAKLLLHLFGIPYVMAPSEGEAQAALMAKKGDVWAVAGKDYDTLLFGAPRMVRLFPGSGREFSPDKGKLGSPKPELIETEEILNRYGITLPQLIDAAILIGTDFNHGIKGIDPRAALDLIRAYRNIEGLPEDRSKQVSSNYRGVRELYLHPPTTERYQFRFGRLDEAGLYQFLCGDRDFSWDSVAMVINKMKAAEART